ncbi:PAS domain-containing sensor histidine kinase [Thalassotalea profundi]|uniref:histidine kinase n=2 Tax=Thalassotalea profundi TaxID=2036687 RepID=A0ABQ3IKB1_9GAMM|nr:PAS domain-containing sensor histidine kinase [Thalassotalea profundi]
MLCLCALAYLFWNYYQLLRLIKWLWRSKTIFPPQASGVWGRIYDGLYRQKKQHRKKLKQLNSKVRQFRDGAEALPDAALVLSNDLTILWGNKKAQQILGVRWPSDMGQRIDNLLRFPEFTQYLEANQFEHPCHIPSPHNNELRIELRLMAYGTDQILLLARDVSKIFRLEEMRRDFVANVSHELKTPLTVVRGYVEMVQSTENVLDPQWSKAFSTIESQVTRMDRLVQQLLVLSRVEIQADEEDKQSVNIPKLLNGLLEDAHWLNQDKQHQITADIDESLNLNGIESELKSAFSNLIANAIAYTPANGKIEISWKQVDAKAKFSVKDNGAGIGPEDLHRLTERFFRVDKSRSRDTGGSGLGLAIVKHVLNHHNAKLSINSQLGEGSEFVIFFELKPQQLCN